MSQADVRKLPEEIKNRLRSNMQINTITQCVTELVFNSLDAKSSSIAVRLNLITHRIQVVDNGDGIALSNLEEIGVRYMTSKCHSVDSFERKQKTYGYRGESLASIITVTRKFQIISRPEESETYLKTFVESNEEPIISIKCRPSKGTTITIEDFLYNCPVRRNRTKKIDINYVKKMLETLTIIFPTVSFSLRNDETGDIILNAHKEKTVSHVLCTLNAGLDIKKFSEIKVLKGNVRISGVFYMTSTLITNMQFFYVNKFPVCLDNLQRLIKKCLYQRLDDIFLSESAYPVYVINIQCPYSEACIYFDSFKYIVEFKSCNTIERCIEKMVKLYIKKYIKQRDRITQISNDTIEVDDENIVEIDTDKKESTDYPIKTKNKKPKKTLGIRFELPKPNQNQKLKNALRTKFQQPNQALQPVVENDLPKSTLNEEDASFVCLANIRNDDHAPNKLLGVFDENFDPQILTLQKLSAQNINSIEHNEREGKKIILETFMKSLPTSEEFLEEKHNGPVLDVTTEDRLSMSEKSLPEINLEITNHADISLCIKQQDNTERKRRSEKLNSVGTHLIEKKIKLQNAIEEWERIDTHTKNEGTHEVMGIKTGKCDVNLQVLLKQLLEQNIASNCTKQVSNTKELVTTATSPFITHHTIACQTEDNSVHNKLETFGRDNKRQKQPLENHKVLVKYNTIATSPLNFEKQDKKEKNRRNNKTSFTYGMSPLKASGLNFVNHYWEGKNVYKVLNTKYDVRRNQDELWENKGVKHIIKPARHGSKDDLIFSNKLQEERCKNLKKCHFIDQNQKRKIPYKSNEDFLFTISPKNKNRMLFDFKNTEENEAMCNDNVTFNSHYFQPTPIKRTPIQSIKELNIRDSTFQNLFEQRERAPQKLYGYTPEKKNNECELNISKYFNNLAADFHEPIKKKRYNKRKSVALDTSSYYFETPDKSIFKNTVFPSTPKTKSVISDSVITFAQFDPEYNSTQKQKDNNRECNFFENFLFKDVAKAAPDPNWLQAFEISEHSEHCETNLFQLERPDKAQGNLFSMKKRIDFVPKGLSPILKEIKVLDVTLSPNSKKNLNNAIVKSFEDELHLVKWMDYINKEDPKEFFNKIYSEKQRMIEKDVPSIHREFKTPHRNHEKGTFNKDILSTLEIIGQLDNKFIVAMSESKLLLFDQHAVHERIRLECLYKEYIIKNSTKNPKFKSTSCSKYIKIPFPDSELCFLKTYKDMFEDIGFDYEIHTSYILVTKIPQCLYKRNMQDQTDEFFYNFLQSLLREEISILQETHGIRSSIPRLLQYVMSTEACRGAIKFGHQLSNVDCEKYVKMLSKCQLPFQCAHGRPTIFPLLTLNPLTRTIPKNNLRKLLVKAL